MKLERFLVAVDYSSCSRAALRFAVELAEGLHAQLDVVHVWDRPSCVSEVVLTGTEPVSLTSLIGTIERNARQDLAKFLSSCHVPPERPLAGRLVSGDPASALLRELKDGQHDAIVVGTHGRTGLSHLLLGSVAEKLVRLASVPVFTVPDAEGKARPA